MSIVHRKTLPDLIRTLAETTQTFVLFPGYLSALPPVVGLTDDSRAVQPGMIFVAETGSHTDGLDYAAQAIERGAVAILAGRMVTLPDELRQRAALLVVPSVRQAAAALAADLYDYPALGLHVTGVTGTDGKTTTTTLISAVLDAAGESAGTSGFLGTAQLKIGSHIEANSTRFTTPKAPQVQELLARMWLAGVSHAVIESSSHALALDRLLYCNFRAAVITNITSEHLDFHGTIEAYIDAKARLFAMLDATPDQDQSSSVPRLRLATGSSWPRVAILNRDDRSYALLAPRISSPILSYGIDDSQADVRAIHVQCAASGSVFTAQTPQGDIAIRTRLPGRFNVSNCLAALAFGISQGIPLDVIAAALHEFPGVPGRMQQVVEGQPFSVIVDYAHTPDSLQKVLRTVRPLTKGRLFVVFGSAGERDRQKRPVMGQVAAQLADWFVLTDEDPRYEDSTAILEEIAAGARAAGSIQGQHFDIVADRTAAIGMALSRAREGDTVVLAGKGHERSILIGGEKYPWNEVETARRCLAGLKGTTW